MDIVFIYQEKAGRSRLGMHQIIVIAFLYLRAKM